MSTLTREALEKLEQHKKDVEAKLASVPPLPEKGTTIICDIANQIQQHKDLVPHAIIRELITHIHGLTDLDSIRNGYAIAQYMRQWVYDCTNRQNGYKPILEPNYYMTMVKYCEQVLENNLIDACNKLSGKHSIEKSKTL